MLIIILMHKKGKKKKLTIKIKELAHEKYFHN